MEDLKLSDDFELKVIVTGSHLLENFGFTYQEIEADGFTIDSKIPFNHDKSDQTSIAIASGGLIGGLAQSLHSLKPDLVMVMGDRYELLSVLTTCVIQNIPIAHLSGGEITEGAIDDQVRHALTKASHLHYVANEVYGSRVSQMGEESWRICICGDPGLDNLYRQPTMTFEELQKDLEMNLLNPTALVTFHPVTLELDELNSQLQELFKALEAATIDYKMQYLITFPNADAGSSYITQEWKKFIKNKPGRRLVKSLGQTRYLSALNYLSMMIGNSSSGLVEAPSFSMPVINIGNRQQGRLKGKNIFDVGHSSAEIIKGIDQALSWDRNISCINPFGNGNSSSKILKHLQYVFTNFNSKKILSKKFINTREVEEAEIKLKVELKK